MPLTPEDARRLDALESAASRILIEPGSVEQFLTTIRLDWDRDGDARRELFHYLRASIVMTLHLTAVAEAHGPCEIEDCATCPPLRIAVAYAYAADLFRREIER